MKQVILSFSVSMLLAASVSSAQAWSGPYGNNYPAPGGWNNNAPWSGYAPYPYQAPNNYQPMPVPPQAYGYPSPQQYYPAPYPYRKKKSGWGNWGSGSTPWSSTPFGNISGPWDSGPWNPDWMDNRGWNRNDVFDDWPGSWFDPEDPRGSMSKMWDDVLEAPNEMGEMPGGWTAPSISVPNPVDVGDEFEGTSRKSPKEAADQLNNFRFN